MALEDTNRLAGDCRVKLFGFLLLVRDKPPSIFISSTFLNPPLLHNLPPR